MDFVFPVCSQKTLVTYQKKEKEIIGILNFQAEKNVNICDSEFQILCLSVNAGAMLEVSRCCIATKPLCFGLEVLYFNTTSGTVYC